jgi:hypothetical protein
LEAGALERRDSAALKRDILLLSEDKRDHFIIVINLII